ncbi:MAG: hypothetical protein V9H69_24350 [Anaerolineae bacterium]
MLRQAQGNGVILESPEGERFILTPIGAWVGFDVGASDDFDRETQNTVANKELMGALERRKARGPGRYLSAEEARRELGLDSSH